MRIIDDVPVNESSVELENTLKYMTVPRFIGKGGKSKDNYRYCDVTMTFDIETTNTPDDGFAYSYQMCIMGVCALVRTWKECASCFQVIAEWAKLNSTKRIVCHVHNLGYEMHYLAPLFDMVYHIKEYLLTDTHKWLSVTFDECYIFRDSLKLFQKSLYGATKGCPHEKAKGDLDYTIFRKPATYLDDNEFRYCVWDVLGLYEAIERLKHTYKYKASNLPLTNTGRVIGAVIKDIEKQKRSMDFYHLKCKLALNKEQLKLAIKCLAGGDTHGARWFSGITLHDGNSADYKSAHPSQMITELYPMGAPIDMGDLTSEEAQTLIAGDYGFLARVGIIDLQVHKWNPDPTISLSKCEHVSDDVILDNGRVMWASSAMVYMDSNDYQRFRRGYNNTDADIMLYDVVAFRLAPLPQYFRNTIIRWFADKENASDTDARNFAKICVNTVFGACASKPLRGTITYTVNADGQPMLQSKSWLEELDEMTDLQVIEKQTGRNKLIFLWGLWTSSLTRLRLFNLLLDVNDELKTQSPGHGVAYWDTDSIKYIGDRPRCIDDFNRRQRVKVRRARAIVEKDDGELVYIGIAEDEHPSHKFGYSEFRFLHAKCYACRTGDEPLQITIAGVGKDDGKLAFADNIENLRDGFRIFPAGGQKLWYRNRPLIDLDTDNPHGSFIYMEPREYIINDPESDMLTKFEVIAN